MNSEFQLLSDKIDQLAELTLSLRRENADLRLHAGSLRSENAGLRSHANVLASQNGDLKLRMQQACQRVSALLELIPAPIESDDLA